jgi:L-alanine-DL-glutamate epimerase-like enolase superfamily enzyme
MIGGVSGKRNSAVKITEIKVYELTGGKREDIAVFEVDHPYLGMNAKGADCYRQWFTEIVTDENISGLCIGGSADVLVLGRNLIGEDPLRTEYLWEKLYHSQYVRTRSTQTIGILDLALWDLKGKIVNQPVYRLLGGQFRDFIPAYAAMLGFSTEPENAAKTSREWIQKGFTAIKWYLPYNETHGAEGLKKNIGIIRSVREAVGEDTGIIVDFGVSSPNKNTLRYVIELAQRLEPYRIGWLEEPLNYDDLDAYRRLADYTRIPISLGERWYNRWQFKEIIAREAASIIQPDPYFAMGLTEVEKIVALASAYGIPVLPHSNESFRHTAHLLFACPERICGMAEFGIKANYNFQYFFKDFYQPQNGFITLPQGNGFGYDIDWDKVKNKNNLII